MYKNLNGKEVELTAEEITEYNNLQAEYNGSARKLRKIKSLRLEKLQETDWWVLRGNMSTAQTNYRQALRDIPSNYDSSKYDELLARDADKKLTHSVWKQPTE
tara:strand:+ start:220 stop:528 length:309 start_codon:yes stop_codon:yes gene_type:complete